MTAINKLEIDLVAPFNASEILKYRKYIGNFSTIVDYAIMENLVTTYNDSSIWVLDTHGNSWYVDRSGNGMNWYDYQGDLTNFAFDSTSGIPDQYVSGSDVSPSFFLASDYNGFDFVFSYLDASGFNFTYYDGGVVEAVWPATQADFFFDKKGEVINYTSPLGEFYWYDQSIGYWMQNLSLGNDAYETVHLYENPNFMF